MGFDYNNTFTLEEAEDHYKSLDIKCKDNYDCPDGSTCFILIERCRFQFHCLEDDDSLCLINTNDCDEEKCKKGRFMDCYLGLGRSECGFSVGEKCSSNDQCLYVDCINGKCGSSEFNFSPGIKFLLISIPILLIILLLICLIYCCCKRNHKKNTKLMFEQQLQPIEGVFE